MRTFHLVSSLLIVFVSVNQIAAGDKEDVQAVIEAIYATANEYDIDANASFAFQEKQRFSPQKIIASTGQNLAKSLVRNLTKALSGILSITQQRLTCMENVR